MYFTLKDSASQIKAVMFRSAVRYLKFKPEDGLKVVARGKVSVYDPKGEYQILCEHMEPKGLGRSEEHTSELQSRLHLVCRLLLEKKNKAYCNNTFLSAA